MRHATMLRLCGELSQPPVTAQYPLAATTTTTTTSGGTSCGVEAGGRSCSGRHKIQTLATVMGTSILATLALALVAVNAQFVEVKLSRYIEGDMTKALFYVILNKK